jgi:hypothetical protein
MRYLFSLCLLATGCTRYGIIELGASETGLVTSGPTGETETEFVPPDADTDTDTDTDSDTDSDSDSDTDVDTEDFSMYDGATLRIVEPASGDFVAWGEPHDFVAELRDPSGALLEYSEVRWGSNQDVLWVPVGMSFEDDALDVGLHDLTAEVDLPNGDRLAHTIGGVLVQSPYAGTYTGLFNATITTADLPVACSGVATLVVDPYGELAQGDAACVVNLLGFETELAFVFDLTNDFGTVGGTSSVDILGLFEFPFDAAGTCDPDDGTMSFAFAGDFDWLLLDGTVDVERITLDAGL